MLARKSLLFMRGTILRHGRTRIMVKTAYISSTYQDLKTHRAAVYKALRKFRYDVFAMEDYIATDERNVAKCCAHLALRRH